MWLFMYACYALAAITYTAFVVSGLQGIYGFAVLGANHPTFSFLTTIIYLFTQTLTIFFFVGISSSVREYAAAHPEAGSATGAQGADAGGRPRPLVAVASGIRGRVSGQIYLNIALFMAQSILGGAIAAGAVPRFIHGTLVAATFLHFHYVLVQEHRAFKSMTTLVLSMTAGARNGADRQPDNG